MRFTSGSGATGLPLWLASHGFASTIAVAILTYFHIVVGEMVPKSLALQHAEQMALLDHAADVVDRERAVPVRGRAERAR